MPLTIITSASPAVVSRHSLIPPKLTEGLGANLIHLAVDPTSSVTSQQTASSALSPSSVVPTAVSDDRKISLISCTTVQVYSVDAASSHAKSGNDGATT